MPQTPATVDDLGLQGCLTLWALITAQERRLPVAPTRRLTLAAMELLRDQGVIQVPFPNGRWEANPAALETPLEHLQWQLKWSVYEPAQLFLALEDYLASVEQDEAGLAIRLRLWTDLANAEGERFFELQLRKHRFPGQWAGDIAFAYRGRHLSLAQWRYCIWAAVRHGASQATQFGPEADRIREAIYAELRRRADGITSGPWKGGALPPYHATPESAMARGFLKHLAPLGLGYWTSYASQQALEMAFKSRCEPR